MKKPSILTTKIFKETIDKKLLETLLCNKHLLTTWTDERGVERSDEKQLTYILQSIKGDTLNVEYQHGINFKNWGRVYPKGLLSLGACRREIRGTLTKGTYIDIDIVNCHPVMILYYLKLYNFPHSTYEKYCAERNTFLKQIQTTYNCDRDIAKKFFIIAGYGGSYNKWKNDNELTGGGCKDLWDSFQNEARSLASKFVMGNYKKYETYIKQQNKTFNKEFSFLSAMLQDQETKILETMEQFFQDEGLIRHNNSINCHDGIMLKMVSILNEVLVRLQNKIKLEFGFEFEIVSKPLEDLLDQIKEEKVKDSDEPFDPKYFNDLKTYENKKIYWERYFCKIMNTTEFIQLDIEYVNGLKSYGFTIFNERNLIISYKQFLEHRIFDSLPEGKPPKRFIDRWLSDDNMRCYKKKGWIPYNDTYKQSDDTIFNMFPGYSTAINSPLPPTYMKWIDPLLDIFKHLCEGNNDNLNFLLHFLAHLIKKPNEKFPFSIIFTGIQGTGKDTLISAIGKLIGSSFTNSESKVENFLGTHAEGLVEKLLVAFNESEASKSFGYEGLMKTLISDDKLTVNKKYQLPYQVRQIARLLVFSNKPNPIKFDGVSKDRRFIAFKTTTKYSRSKYEDFWGKMYKIMDRPEFAASFYYYLNNIDVDNYKWKRERKKVLTETYRDMVRKQLPPVVDFVIDFLDKYDNKIDCEMSSCEYKIDESQLWNDYKRWQRKNRPDSTKDNGYIGTKRNFKSSFKELDIPLTFYRSDGICRVRFIPDECRFKLCSKGWIENEFIEEESESEIEYDFNQFIENL